MSQTKRGRGMWAVFAMPPPDINTDRWVTATYPAALGTVLSVHSNGTTGVLPAGTEKPSTWAVLKPDRLVYAPLGPAGNAFWVPHVDKVPNE